MRITSALTSTPPPRTKPRVVVLASSAGFAVELVLVTLLITLVTVCVRPLSVFQATPALTYGWMIFPLKRYLARIGNSQEPLVVSIFVRFVAMVLMTLLEL